MTETSIGMMDSAYFVPRQEILKWINTILDVNLQYIEDLGQGSVYCHLLDAAFTSRNAVSMAKINWRAKFEYDCVANLKQFQLALDKIGSLKKIDIQKLAKTRYQQNLQTIQWLKKYIEINGSISPNYNAPARRNHATLESVVQNKKNPGLKKDHNSASSKRLSYKAPNGGSSKRLKITSQEKENKPGSNPKVQKTIQKESQRKRQDKSSAKSGIVAKEVNDYESLVRIRDILLNQPYVENELKIKMITTIVVEQTTVGKQYQIGNTSHFMDNQDEVML